MSEDKIAEIRERHKETQTRLARATRSYMPVSEYEGLGWQLQRDRATLLAEVDRLRAEIERLFNEDTKTRHALKGWVFVCPDGGDEPTHERVAAVVAEVERHRAENERLRAEIKLLRPTDLSPAEKLQLIDDLRAQEKRRRAALEGKQ